MDERTDVDLADAIANTEAWVRVRSIPGTASTCQLCKRPIVWATTVAGPNGPGGKSQPFDPYEAPDGNVAVYPAPGHRLRARALHKGEDPATPFEFRAMPHAATCAKAPTGANPRLPAEVVDLAAHRARRAGR